MMFLTEYRTKPFMTKGETTEMMELFARVGEAPGTVAHYVDVDGGGGWILSETDDPTANYANTIRYEPYLQIKSNVVMPVDQAVPMILEGLS